MQRSVLNDYLKKLLSPQMYNDYCPNGLQIEGKEEIKKIAYCVSATRESIEKAVDENVDALIVHHGLFWKFHGIKTITGAFGARVKPLIQKDINLFAYHLPLDGNIEFGNAASIAKLLDLCELKNFGDHKKMPTGVSGQFSKKLTANQLKEKLEKILNHNVLLSSPDDQQVISNIGIITGGANSNWKDCLKCNLDSYLTGEMSEHDWHDAKENGIHMFAGGHNATERFGILALKNIIDENFEVNSIFIDSKNPA